MSALPPPCPAFLRPAHPLPYVKVEKLIILLIVLSVCFLESHCPALPSTPVHCNISVSSPTQHISLFQLCQLWYWATSWHSAAWGRGRGDLRRARWTCWGTCWVNIVDLLIASESLSSGFIIASKLSGDKMPNNCKSNEQLVAKMNNETTKLAMRARRHISTLWLCW